MEALCCFTSLCYDISTKWLWLEMVRVSRWFSNLLAHLAKPALYATHTAHLHVMSVTELLLISVLLQCLMSKSHMFCLLCSTGVQPVIWNVFMSLPMNATMTDYIQTVLPQIAAVRGVVLLSVEPDRGLAAVTTDAINQLASYITQYEKVIFFCFCYFISFVSLHKACWSSPKCGRCRKNDAAIKIQHPCCNSWLCVFVDLSAYTCSLHWQYLRSLPCLVRVSGLGVGERWCIDLPIQKPDQEMNIWTEQKSSRPLSKMRLHFKVVYFDVPY